MTAALEIKDLQAWYGESHILHGISLSVAPGEVVTLLGRNGAGRTTTLRAIMGLTGRRTGSIRINGVEAVGLPTHRIAHLGVGYCPEERGIFSSLSTEENLLLPPALKVGGTAMSIDEIYEMFPNLKERRHSQGTRLSGGEQQMLAVARILRTGARLLLLDEISEGLAPVIVQGLARMITMLKAKGYTIIMVEQNFRFAAPLADRFHVVEHGQIVETIEARDLECTHACTDRVTRRVVKQFAKKYPPQKRRQTNETYRPRPRRQRRLSSASWHLLQPRSAATPSRSACSPTCPASIPTSTATVAPKPSAWRSPIWAAP
jgi:branched-chain amino acid transport system ATP-binding protein